MSNPHKTNLQNIAQHRPWLLWAVAACLLLGLLFILRSQAAVCEDCVETPGLKVFDAMGARTMSSDWEGEPEKLAGLPNNLTSPVDYTAGDAYARFEVLEKPSNVNTVVLFCANDQYFNERCSYNITTYQIEFKTTGTLYVNLGKPKNWQQVSAGSYNFDVPMHKPYLQFVDKDYLDQIIAGGADPTDLNFDEEVKAVMNGFYYDANVLRTHLPIKVDVEIYMTPANTRFKPPAHWNCPATICPSADITPTAEPTLTPSPSPTTSPTPTDAPTPTITPTIAPTPLPSGTPNPGDIDGDSHVNFTDLSILIRNYKKSVSSRAEGDLDGDGAVTILDLSRLVKYWGT